MGLSGVAANETIILLFTQLAGKFHKVTAPESMIEIPESKRFQYNKKEKLLR